MLSAANRNVSFTFSSESVVARSTVQPLTQPELRFPVFVSQKKEILNIVPLFLHHSFMLSGFQCSLMCTTRCYPLVTGPSGLLSPLGGLAGSQCPPCNRVANIYPHGAVEGAAS